VSYLLQVRSIEREALALQAQAPFMEEGSKLPTVGEALEEFDEWLTSDPDGDGPSTPADAEMAELHALLVGERRGR
jgi:hypothetical protein